MELSEQQKRQVAEWVSSGDSLSEVQKLILSEFGVSMTFMDVRLLVDDLGATLKDKEQAPRPAGIADVTVGAGSAAGGIVIEMDRVTKPGAVVSGTVTFVNGERASWALDSIGRLALSPENDTSRPGPEDIRAFQEELGRQLQQRGF